MTSFKPVAAVAALLTLAACSTSGSDSSSAPSFQQSFAGVWTVTHAWPAGGVIGSPAPEGQTIALTTSTAADPLGRACPQPGYSVAPGRVSTALGVNAPANEEGTVLDVSCAGRPFARYVAQGGRLLSVAEGWLFELKPAATVASTTTRAVPAPQPVVAVAPAPAKPAKPAKPVKAAKPPAPAKPAAVAAKGGDQLYLASYRSQDTAAAGWTVLQRQAPGLKGLQPAYKEVDLGAKGRFVRLYASGASAQTQGEICGALKKTSPDCGARY